MNLSEKNDYVYCTAVIQSTRKVAYEELVENLQHLRKEMITEAGCVMFEIVPLERRQERFALWEIWQNKGAFYAHHEQEYTKEFFKKELDTIEFFESSERVEL